MFVLHAHRFLVAGECAASVRDDNAPPCRRLCRPGSAWSMLHPQGGSVANDPAYRAGQASSSAAGAYRPAIAATGRDEARLRSELHYVPKRGGSEWYTPDDGLTGNVADLLRMATFAHRQGCGELIWFGWCPHEGGKHGKAWPWKGSHGLMMTKKGAASVAQAMAVGKVVRGHIDLRLLEWLRSEGEATKAGACFIWPSVGSYFVHPSVLPGRSSIAVSGLWDRVVWSGVASGMDSSRRSGSGAV